MNHGKIVVEIIFVTDDREISHFERNFKKMPWLAVPFDDNHKIQNLKSRFGVCDIPTLVVVNPWDDCKVLEHDAVQQIGEGPSVIDKWKEESDR